MITNSCVFNSLVKNYDCVFTVGCRNDVISRASGKIIYTITVAVFSLSLPRLVNTSIINRPAKKSVA